MLESDGTRPADCALRSPPHFGLQTIQCSETQAGPYPVTPALRLHATVVASGTVSRVCREGHHVAGRRQTVAQATRVAWSQRSRYGVRAGVSIWRDCCQLTGLPFHPPKSKNFFVDRTVGKTATGSTEETANCATILPVSAPDREKSPRCRSAFVRLDVAPRTCRHSVSQVGGIL